MEIKDAWESYVKEVLPADCGTTQFIETRRAFYGGARAMFSALFKGLASGGDEMTPADEAFIIGLENELNQFTQDVKGGRA